jgi:uncharacterized protein
METFKDTFKENPIGILVSIEPDSITGFLYNIWFPYTRSNIKETQEGNLIAIKNFSSNGSCCKYSILELTSVMPAHYALGSSPSEIEKAFPGFVVEAAKSARIDWEQEKPIEQTTKIKTQARPTSFELDFESGQHRIVSESGMPMIGEDVYLLSNSAINEVINKDLLSGKIPTIEPCELANNRAIKVRISVEDLLRTHFGVFGFTGSGKSNLMSTLIFSLFKNRNMKVIMFDLMVEYPALMIDLLSTIEDAYIVALDEQSLPGGNATSDYLLRNGSVDAAADSIIRTLLLPKQLADYRDDYQRLFKIILQSGKIRLYSPGGGDLTYGDVHSRLLTKIEGRLGNTQGPIERWVNKIDKGPCHITIKELRQFDFELDSFTKNYSIPMDFQVENSSGQTMLGGGQTQKFEPVKLNDTANTVIYNMKTEIQSFIRSLDQSSIPEKAVMSFQQMKVIANEPGRNALFIVQSNRDDVLRTTSASMVNRIYEDRRHNGIIAPQILFVFDEADEFMPREGGDTYAESRAAIATLARRGRKFGMGVTFATQRVAYLDTSILAQPHTYLISKLTRQYDRDTISQSFGIADDILRKTLKFSIGEWLLVSYEATGLSNVPLPVHFPNANTRIREFLKNS